MNQNSGMTEDIIMSNCNNCTTKHSDYNSNQLYTWCTNCGNYAIHEAVKRALVAECIEPKDILLCFDIGCNGNGSDKIEGYRAHGLHGRVLPFATGASLANKRVKILAFGGDGGTLSEGINHLIHSIRGNFDITFILHNNSNYGLTKGQASTTTKAGTPMNSSPFGTTSDTLNPMDLVLALNPSFAARAFSGQVKHMTEIIRKALSHKGFSFVEVLQNCPTFNKSTPHEWYMNRIYDVESIMGYNTKDLSKAREVATDMEERIAIGVLYQNESEDFYTRLVNREGVETELVDEVRGYSIDKILNRFK